MPFALYRETARISDVFETERELWYYVRENGFCTEAIGNEWTEATRVLRQGYLIFSCRADGETRDDQPQKSWI